MAVRKLRISGDPVLRQKAKRVSTVDASVRQLLDDMVETMHAESGCGLAAPQVGVSLRAIVIEVAPGEEGGEPQIYHLVNPEIVKGSEEEILEEGCLSVPGYWGKVKRYKTVTFKALDRNGKKIREKATGLFAQAVQHEIDHLDGVLYTDRAEEVWEIDQEARAARRAARETAAA